ncbi:MAG: HNH endonuclease [Sphingopyxis sp.]|uniref:HNH endonuclease signature motif containing protein n=1 Tax=Sphingopyxis sp. TaxID=1908224 RepID=UPI001A445ACB|nr:HNH endonuclease signature motif containing protein [Sphingopyxis sp.]MBL9070421.1 HNH endonuclease [Sphingopyxis sp.]
MAKIRKDCVPIGLLRELIAYDPATGVLVWLPRRLEHFASDRVRACGRWNARYANKPALTAVEQSGYLHGDMMGKRYKAHRVAWALHHGEWPSLQIDHINGDPADNRIENLRSVTAQINMQNQRLSSASTSGVTGVSWASHRNKWSAQIKVNGVKHHLGLFDSIGDAAAARKAADRRFGFHSNHGRAAA